MIVTPGLNISVGQKEDGQDDGNDIPSREDQAVVSLDLAEVDPTHVKVSTGSPIFPGSYSAEKRTMAGICSRQTCRAYAEPISILSLVTF